MQRGLTAIVVLLLATSTLASPRDDAVHHMGAAFALGAFCPDMRYSTLGIAALETVFSIDLKDPDTYADVLSVRKDIGENIKRKQPDPAALCPFAWAWYGPAGTLLPGLLKSN